MNGSPNDPVLATLTRAVHPLTGDAADYDPLLERIGNARVVLLGEATHGTHEFYRERVRITERLIREMGFSTIAVEADWPDAYRVNRYVRGSSRDRDADEALSGFQRFPLWMWRNTDVASLVEMLRDHNRQAAGNAPAVGFYGLDLYSLYSSIEAVLGFLERIDPEAAERARHRYACFEHFGEDSQAYGYVASTDRERSCEDQAVAQLIELQRRAAELLAGDGGIPEDEVFFAEQNARLVKNAEEYYRSMYRGRVSSWNLRDRHMAETLDALIRHADGKGVRARVVVWAHNSHIGDARATEMARRGEWNLGQLARERFGGKAVLVGFTTATGTVAAARDWGMQAEVKEVRPPLPDSWEALFHDVGTPRFLLPLRGDRELDRALRAPRLERAIGVVYRPETERASHYFRAALGDQFDFVVHVDRTRAVDPLPAPAGRDLRDPPETYPFAV